MAEVIDELLVRLGLETDRQQFQQAEAQFASLRRGAMAFAGTIGAGLGLDALSRGVAGVNDQLGLASQRLGVTARDLDSLGYALARSGGQAENAVSLLGSATNAIDQLVMGNIPGFELASRWGLDPESLQRSADGMQFLLRLSDQIQGLTTQEQRNVLDAFGLGGEATFQLLSGGRNDLEGLLGQAQELSPTMGELVDNSRAFNESLVDLQRSIRGVTNIVSDDLIQDLTGIANAISGWLGEGENRQQVSDLLEKGPFLSTWELIQGLFPGGLKDVEIRRGQGGGSTTLGDMGNDVDTALLEAVLWQESRGRHRDASGNLTTNPNSGARGAYQIMPNTGRDPGYGIEPLRNDSPAEHRRFADDYLGAMMDEFDGDVKAALAAYNWGPGNVQRAQQQYGENWLSYAPAETQQYVPAVMAGYQDRAGTTIEQNIRLEVNGAQDPRATADEVERILRRTADQSRQDTANGVY